MLIFVSLGWANTPAQAQDFATIAEAKTMLEKASSFVREHGSERAAQVFMDENGPFRDRDLYISMSRSDTGARLAHANKRLIGRSIFSTIDADGKPYGEMIRTIALKNGRGRLDYRIVNPMTGTPMQKTSLIECVNDVVLVVGAYR